MENGYLIPVGIIVVSLTTVWAYLSLLHAVSIVLITGVILTVSAFIGFVWYVWVED